MPRKSKIQIVEERLARIEQAVTNDLIHRLNFHEKLIYVILAFLLAILGTLLVETLK
jgi:hypothetical protein